MKPWHSIILAVLVLGGAHPAQAGVNADAVITVHLSAPLSKLPCTNAIIPPDCQGLTTDAAHGSYSVYFLVANHSDSLGVAGTQFGVNYDGTPGVGVDVDGWTPCGDLEFPSATFPNPNSGTIVTWEKSLGCQVGPVPALAGVMNVTSYSDDCLYVVPRPLDGRAKVADCLSAEDDITDLTPSHLGYACFGVGQEGYNPCSVIIAVESTTWGRMKTLFN